MLQRFDVHPHAALLDTASLRELERRLAKEQATHPMVLAGRATRQLALAVAPHAQRCWVAAGPGNNGGDGLEAAWNLHTRGVKVTVTLLSSPEKLPADAHAAWQRAIAAGVQVIDSVPPWLSSLDKRDICIDALLGIGASRAVQGQMLQAVHALNSCAAQVLALDVPTGLNAHSGQALDENGRLHSVVHADHTLTFLAGKPGLFMGHGRDACGQIWLDTLASAKSAAHASVHPVAERNPAARSLTARHAGHKGLHGDVAILGGESLSSRGMGMGGACLLAASAALHAGAGRVMLSWLGGQPEHLPEHPDLMLRRVDKLEMESLTTVCGCGAGAAVEDTLPEVLQRSHRLVLDADALNAIARTPQLGLALAQRPAGSTVLTPHPLEAARLLGLDVPQVQADRLQSAQSLARQFNCVVVLKGSGTVIADPVHTPRINTSGNGLLSIGGTGDVLAGLIGARMGQGLSGFEAASAAVWQHGHTADLWPPGLALTASRLARHLTR